MSKTPSGQQSDAPATKGPSGEESFLRRPSFASSYPRDPKLDRLVTLFVRGNHAAVRAEAEALAASAATPEIAAAARDLRQRVEPDRLAFVLLGVSALLLVTLTSWALYRSKQYQNTPAPKPAPTQQIIR